MPTRRATTRDPKAPTGRKRSPPRKGGPARDAAGTQQRLLDAVGRLLARDGFTSLGINSVAEEAGADKVLIYRYFGGFPGLLEAYAAGEAFWPSNAQLVGEDVASFLALPPSERLIVLLHNYLRELRRRPITHSILAWEVISRNELTVRLEEVRERRGLDLVALLGDVPSSVDLPALFALVSAAVHYLLMRARLIQVFLGIDLRSDEGWARLESMIALFVRTLFEAKPPKTAAGHV